MRSKPSFWGVIATCSLTAGVFFLKFWRRTRRLALSGFRGRIPNRGSEQN